jgi:hypothetical protein
MSDVAGISTKDIYLAMERWTKGEQDKREEIEEEDQHLHDQLNKAKTIEEIDQVIDACPMRAGELLIEAKYKRHALWLQMLRHAKSKKVVIDLFIRANDRQDQYYAIQKLSEFFQV